MFSVTFCNVTLFSVVTVVVLCASPQAVREIMIKAHELNFDNGEYVFFNIDLFSRYSSSSFVSSQ